MSAWVDESPGLSVIVRADAATTTDDLLTALRLPSTAGVISARLATQSVTAGG